jgi:hypothetical protein
MSQDHPSRISGLGVGEGASLGAEEVGSGESGSQGEVIDGDKVELVLKILRTELSRECGIVNLRAWHQWGL